MLASTRTTRVKERERTRFSLYIFYVISKWSQCILSSCLLFMLHKVWSVCVARLISLMICLHLRFNSYLLCSEETFYEFILWKNKFEHFLEWENVHASRGSLASHATKSQQLDRKFEEWRFVRLIWSWVVRKLHLCHKWSRLVFKESSSYTNDCRPHHRCNHHLKRASNPSSKLYSVSVLHQPHLLSYHLMLNESAYRVSLLLRKAIYGNKEKNLASPFSNIETSWYSQHARSILKIAGKFLKLFSTRTNKWTNEWTSTE